MTVSRILGTMWECTNKNEVAKIIKDEIRFNKPPWKIDVGDGGRITITPKGASKFS